jgi:all-trans-retinol 13,14-reductase
VTDHDAIVIGSGIGGLTAALALARRGRSVCVLEALPRPGGLIKPHVSGGYDFDVGLQYVGQAGPGQVFPRYLEELGVDVSFRELPADGLERYVFPGFETRLVKGPEAQLELLLAAFPREERGLRGFFETLHAFDVLQALATGEGREPWKVGAALRGLPGLRGATSLPFATWLGRGIRDPLLVTALSCFAGDLALPPGRASTLASLIDWTHFMRGAWYPEGGGGALVAGLLRGLAARGAEVRTDAEVVGLVPDGDRLEVALAGGDALRARTVVSSADATSTLGWLPEGAASRAAARKAATFRPSLSACGAFLGVEGDLAPLTDANLWVYESDDLEEVYGPPLRGEDAARLGVFFTAPTLKEPARRRAPEGRHGLMVLAFAPAVSAVGPAPPRWSEEATRRRVARVLDVVGRTLPRARVVWRQDITPTTFWRQGRARLGGLYGPEMSVAQGLPRRFAPWTGVPGLFLAGASVLGGGVLPSLLSGRIAAGLAERRLRR